MRRHAAGVYQAPYFRNQTLTHRTTPKPNFSAWRVSLNLGRIGDWMDEILEDDRTLRHAVDVEFIALIG